MATLPARDVPCPFCGVTVRVTPTRDRGTYDEWYIPEDHTCPGHDEIEVSIRLSADHQDAWNEEYLNLNGPDDDAYLGERSSPTYHAERGRWW